MGIKSISENDRRDSFDTSSKTTTSNKEKYKSSPTTINSFHSDNSIKRPIQREENCVFGTTENNASYDPTYDESPEDKISDLDFDTKLATLR